jgi:FkbM family methyltransferase
MDALERWRERARRVRDVRTLERHGESVSTNVGDLFVHSHDEIITPVLRAEHRMPDVDIEALGALELRGATVLDVGANIGYTTLQLAKLVSPDGHVVAVEPHPANLRLLRANLYRNGARNVDVVAGAAWRSTGRVELGECDENTGDHRVGALLDKRRVLSVPALRLDDVVPRDANVRFILIDTQATEHVALEGAHELVARRRPVIFSEFWPSGIRVFGDDPHRALMSYRALDYRLRCLEVPELGDDASDEQIIAAIDARPGPFGGFATLVMTPHGPI